MKSAWRFARSVLMPVGSQPRSTYWARRLLSIVALALVLGASFALGVRSRREVVALPPAASRTATSAGAPTTTTSKSTAASTTLPPSSSYADLFQRWSCSSGKGDSSIADGLRERLHPNGSLKLIEIVLDCPLSFESIPPPGGIRPRASWETIAATPSADVTANQAQREFLATSIDSLWNSHATTTTQAG